MNFTFIFRSKTGIFQYVVVILTNSSCSKLIRFFSKMNHFSGGGTKTLTFFSSAKSSIPTTPNSALDTAIAVSVVLPELIGLSGDIGVSEVTISRLRDTSILPVISGAQGVHPDRCGVFADTHLFWVEIPILVHFDQNSKKPVFRLFWTISGPNLNH